MVYPLGPLSQQIQPARMLTKMCATSNATAATIAYANAGVWG